MPQMMPMLWTLTFLLVFTTFMLSISLIYYLYLPNLSMNINMMNKSNWPIKW